MSRIDRINELMKREISSMLLDEISDPRLKFVTITSVDVSKDLQHAKVYYSVLGADRKAVAQALEKASGYVRKLVGQKIVMRYTPEIDFIFDKSVEYSDRIEQALQDIQREQDTKKSSS